MHRAEAGRQALERIELEIRDNLRDVRDVREAIVEDGKRAKPLEDWATRISAALKSGTPDARIRDEIIIAAAKTTPINLATWPQLRHAAWDVAVANQSAAAIDPLRLQSISDLYSAQRDFNAIFQTNQMFVNASHLVDTMTDLDLGKVEPREFLHALAQARTSVMESRNSPRYVERYLENATGEKSGAPANNASAASTSASN